MPEHFDEAAFHQDRGNLSKTSTNHNCHLQAFPSTAVKRIRRKHCVSPSNRANGSFSPEVNWSRDHVGVQMHAKGTFTLVHLASVWFVGDYTCSLRGYKRTIL